MKSKNNIHNIRRDYTKSRLFRSELNTDPYQQFCIWFEEICSLSIPDPTAFVLTTATLEGKPSSRIVLLKDHTENGFVFFTNYRSRKGQQIEANPDVSMLFFWPEAERQVRIEGKAKKISENDSDAYFKSRPLESQIAAIIFRQSQPVNPETDLDEVFKFAVESMCPTDLIRPDYWGGYIIVPEMYEFWQGRPGRMHDRFMYLKENYPTWKIIQLQP